MREENQAGAASSGCEPPEEPPRGPEAAPGPAPHPAFEFLEAEPPPPGGPAPPEPAPIPLPPPGMAAWFWILALLGLGALFLRQVEAAFLVAVAGLFITAQGAEVHPVWRRLHALVAWVTPALGASFLIALASLILRDGHLTATRLSVALFAALGVLASLLSMLRPVADVLVRLLFRGATPGHTLRLGARAVLAALWFALPAWFAFRDQIADLLQDPQALVSARSLSGGLVGYLVLAFASVGFLVRRTWRQSLERLGLARPGPAEWLVVAAGVLALWLFNSGSEALQRTAFPALWASDQRFTEALAGTMGPGQMVLLGLSAGMGEEITLRGALQPRLGIGLTSLLFAVLHIQYSWYGMLSILVFGLILGVIRQRSSTTAAILVHGLYDLLALVFAKG